MARTVRGLAPLPEVGVHREVVPHAVLPAVVLRAEVRVVLAVNINSCVGNINSFHIYYLHQIKVFPKAGISKIQMKLVLFKYVSYFSHS